MSATEPEPMDTTPTEETTQKTGNKFFGLQIQNPTTCDLIIITNSS